MQLTNGSAKSAPPRKQKPYVDKPWLPPHPRSYKLIHANIVDPLLGKIIEDSTVFLVDGRIAEVNGETSSAHTDNGFHEDVTVIDLEGRYLCPGLIDSHVHLTAVPGEIGLKNTFKNTPEPMIHFRTAFLCKEMLSRGFTTARDCGGASGSLKEAIAEWLVPGPRLLIAGHALSQTGGHGDQRDAHVDDPTTKCCGGHKPGIGRLCDGVTGCSIAVRDEMRRGADFIKIMGGGGVASKLNNLEHVQFLEEEIQAITRTAATYNTYVTCHAYTCRAIRHAVDNGVKGIEHGNFIDVDTAKYLAERGVYMTPTLVTYHAMSEPPFDNYLSDDCQVKNQRVLQSGLRSLEIAEQAGVQLCFGSDLLAGMHRQQSYEFALRSKVQSSLSVLRSATTTGAKMMGLEGQVGRLVPGSFADMLVLERNPLDDVSALDQEEQISVVMKEGRVFKSLWDAFPVDTPST